MPSPFDEIDVFFASDEATAATWGPKAGGSIAGLVWLDAPDVNEFADVVTASHRITYRVSQWAALAAGDTVTIGAAVYDVRSQYALDDGLLAQADLIKR